MNAQSPVPVSKSARKPVVFFILGVVFVVVGVAADRGAVWFALGAVFFALGAAMFARQNRKSDGDQS
jgi:hypothetical protein